MPESSYAQCLETLNVRVSKSMAISINTSLLPSILLVAQRLIFTAANCHLKYEWSSGRFDQTGIKHRAMLGHCFKNFTVKTSFDCHVKCFDERCRCQAYQIWGNRCELLDEDAYSAPDDLVNVVGYSYFDLNREYVVKSSDNNACSNQPCSNQCCNESPCAHGGTCTELCDHAKRKFNCTCKEEFDGRFCQKRRATSCKQILRRERHSQSSVYHLFDPVTSSMYETFCDFTSENGFVWTLIESFSFANNNAFKSHGFSQDHPVNQMSFSWAKLRLSKSRMTAIANHSTHVRATCNFNTDGLTYTDYLRAKLSEINIMVSKDIFKCKLCEKIDIRGHGCNNCTVLFSQSPQKHAHVDSRNGSNTNECEASFPGAVASPSGEDDFGFYGTRNREHRCTSNDNSTTQWWFGEQQGLAVPFKSQNVISDFI